VKLVYTPSVTETFRTVVDLSAKFCMLINDIIPATKNIFIDLSSKKERGGRRFEREKRERERDSRYKF
jgi:hypothetical protein